MKRRICHINMTVMDDGETSTAEGHITFHGKDEDMIHTLAHIFTALELEPLQAIHLSVEAADVMLGGEDKE